MTTVHAYTSDQSLAGPRQGDPQRQARPAPHARRRPVDHPEQHRRGAAPSASCCPSSRASSTAPSLRVPDAHRLDHRPVGEPRRDRSTVDEINAAFAEAAATTSRTAACSSTPTSRSCRPTSSATRRRASSRRATRWRTDAWSRCSAGTTTSGATRTASSTSSRSSARVVADPHAVDLPRLEDLPAQDAGSGCSCASTSTCRCATATIEDDLRITTALPTINWLRDRGAVVVVRGPPRAPEGQASTRSTRWRRSAERLRELLGATVLLAPAVVGPRGRADRGAVEPGRRRACSRTCASSRGRPRTTPRSRPTSPELGDVYVNEAFGASHRAHASIVGPPRVLPHAGGPAAAPRGRGARRRCSTTPARPFVAVLGGAKVSDKLGVIDALLDRCDTVLIGGAMAFTFLLAQGTRVGDSLVEPDMVDECSAPARHRPGARSPPTS